MSDIVIDDGYVKEIGDFISKQGERFENFIARYTTVLVRVVSEGIKSGRTAESILQYIELVRQLEGVVGSISELGKSLTEKYMEDIDAADDFLY